MNPIGMDVSHWDGVIDWAKAKNAGLKFAFIKATQSTDFFDSKFCENWSGSAGKMPRGAYHYYEASADPLAQARWFCGKVDWSTAELPGVGDIEDTTGIPYSSLPKFITRWIYKIAFSRFDPTDVKQYPCVEFDNVDYFAWPKNPHRYPVQTILAYADRVQTFLAEVERLSGRIPIIYTAQAYWDTYLGAHAIDWADQYPLWLANYRKDAGPLVPPPWSPTGWAFWQYTDKGKGSKYGVQALDVDLNVFNGDENNLREFIAQSADSGTGEQDA